MTGESNRSRSRQQMTSVPSNVITDMKVVKQPSKKQKKEQNDSIVSGMLQNFDITSARTVALRLDLAPNPQLGHLQWYVDR